MLYQKTGVYHDLCDEGTPISDICDAQQLRLTALYTVGAFTNTCASIIMGVWMDRMGPRASACLGNILGILACILLAFSSPSFDVYFPGIILLCLSGVAVHLSHFHISSLFPTHQSLITSLFAGAFGLSGITFPILLALYNYGASVKQLFLGLACVVGGFLVVTCFTASPVPFDQLLRSTMDTVSVITDTDSTLKKEDQDLDAEAGNMVVQTASPRRNDGRDSSDSSTHLLEGHLDSDYTHSKEPEETEDNFVWFTPDESELKAGTLSSQLRSHPFIFMLFFVSIHNLRSAFYLGSVDLQLQKMNQAEGDSSTYLGIFFLVYPFGAVFSFPTGHLLDSRNPHHLAMLINVLGIVWSILGLVDSLKLQVLKGGGREESKKDKGVVTEREREITKKQIR